MLKREYGRRKPPRADAVCFPTQSSRHFTLREKAALRYAELFKQGEHAIDKDEVYHDLSKHFSDEEIIEIGLFCAEVEYGLASW